MYWCNIKKHILFCPYIEYSSDIAIWISKLYIHKWRQLGYIWQISQRSDGNSISAKTGIKSFMIVFLIDFCFMCLLICLICLICLVAKLNEFLKKLNFETKFSSRNRLEGLFDIKFFNQNSNQKLFFEYYIFKKEAMN